MNEINGVEKIFLGRLESLLSKFDEIDSIVNDIEEMIEECVKEGIGTVAIANKFNVKAPYISFLKKKYGLNKKD